jgi:hypothetical protein
MNYITKGSLLIIFILSIIPQTASAQFSNKKIKPKYEAYTDSLKNVEYNYVFPIFGQGAYKKGFDIPYPAGVMANYIWLDQGLLISDLQLGLKTDEVDIPLTDVNFIEFGENRNTSYALNIRPDLWVLPFLNVYGLFGYGTSHTVVNLTAPIELKSVVDQSIKTAGVGVLAAGGIGPIWFSVDINFTWNYPELLDEPTKVNVTGIRLGHTFVFKNKPQSNIAVWVGGMRLHMATITRGAITLGDALPPEAWDRKDEIVENYWDWYNNLGPGEIGKKKIADEILTPIVDRIDQVDGDAIISYGMNKQTQQLWNGTVGMQYQLNKRWMLRSEAGLIGDRKSFMVSFNYRFLL